MRQNLYTYRPMTGSCNAPRNLIQRLVNALDDRLDDEERMYPGEGYMPLIAEARAYLAASDGVVDG